jgi:hypothetical protein
MKRKAPPPFPSLTLKSLPVRSYRQFPRAQGLYFVYPWYAFGRCRYVGMTLNREGFRGRWTNHDRYPQAARIGARIHFWQCPRGTTQSQLLKLEQEQIRKLRPRWNNSPIPRPHPPWVDSLGKATDWAIALALVLSYWRLLQ